MEQVNWNRTDLVDEAEEVLTYETQQQKEKTARQSGVVMEELKENRVEITKVIVSQEGEKQIGKKKGTYITLSIPTLYPSDTDGFTQLQQVLQKYIAMLLEDIQYKAPNKILIVGLGNKTITPDAIGPIAIDELQSAFSESPNEQFVMYAPGVTGQTGFETSEFVKALAEKIKPAAVIVIDALATRSSKRLCRTIQLTDTGIHPGSGVGNQRAEISQEVLGVPVLAIGIPTVVEATVLLADAVDTVFRTIATRIGERGKPSGKLSVTGWRGDTTDADLNLVKPIFGEWSTWSIDDKRQLFEEVFHAQERFIVTPKEVDIWLMQYAHLISNSLFDLTNS
ncbi:GPR endopeptidase [Metasolibacillus sp.]|uniref:GPR endopeptidase n=1 Tax=Metasolibacillus sp. TaxID=2703680 RepID=UPI0025F9E069|nr:GPR endopeptidase [Metasolibacillus sp.]MCT6923274.1 GPR endopeptidase [Metasolibacillus sp.]MCT6939421.1 GPR endopeptidase [Metasolibacillus sp.]